MRWRQGLLSGRAVGRADDLCFIFCEEDWIDNTVRAITNGKRVLFSMHRLQAQLNLFGPSTMGLREMRTFLPEVREGSLEHYVLSLERSCQKVRIFTDVPRVASDVA